MIVRSRRPFGGAGFFVGGSHFGDDDVTPPQKADTFGGLYYDVNRMAANQVRAMCRGLTDAGILRGPRDASIRAANVGVDFRVVKLR